MQKDQLIKKLNEAKEHLLKARGLLYDIFKEIEQLEKKVIKSEERKL